MPPISNNVDLRPKSSCNKFIHIMTKHIFLNIQKLHPFKILDIFYRKWSSQRKSYFRFEKSKSSIGSAMCFSHEPPSFPLKNWNFQTETWSFPLWRHFVVKKNYQNLNDRNWSTRHGGNSGIICVLWSNSWTVRRGARKGASYFRFST